MKLVRASAKLLTLLLFATQLVFGLWLFYLRHFEQGRLSLPEFSLKEDSLILMGHLVAYFTILFIPAHLIFFFSRGARHFRWVLVGSLLGLLGPVLGYVATWGQLGFLVILQGFLFLGFALIWIRLSLQALELTDEYYSFRLNEQK